MKTESLNATELAFMQLEFENTTRKMTHLIPMLDGIQPRRLSYLLIETRRAACAEAGKTKTLKEIIDGFHVGYDTYYSWREKWYTILPEHIKKYVR